MAETWNGKQVSFRSAGLGEAAEVLEVLDEAAAWLQQRGIRQWPARFELSWVEAGIRLDETWLVVVGDTAAGTITLDWADPIWGDIDGSAGYLHRMAVRRSASGLGAVILDWAQVTARQHGRHALRLDCVASNHRLRAYYEAAGLVHPGGHLRRRCSRTTPGPRTNHPPQPVRATTGQQRPAAELMKHGLESPCLC